MEFNTLRNLEIVVKPLKNSDTVIRNSIKESATWKEEHRAFLPKSWIRALRQALDMPVSVIAKKLGKSPQAVIEFEKSEENKKITLESLSKIADAMGMKLVYGFVPKADRDLDDMIRRQAVGYVNRLINEGKVKIEGSVYTQVYHEKKLKLVNSYKNDKPRPRTFWQ